MKKILFVLAIIAAGILLAEEQPPYEVTSPSISENFRQIYYQVNDLDNRTVKYKDLNRELNVKDYGAKCDGTTDDASSIQAVLDIAYANRGGIVFIPVGVCRIGSTLTIYENTTLLGAAMKRKEVTGGDWTNQLYGSMLRATDTLDDPIIINQGSGSNITLDSLTFDMNARSAAPTFAAVRYLTVRNCYFYNDEGSVFLLTGPPDATWNQHCFFENVVFDCTTQALAVDNIDIGSGFDIHMDKCYFKGGKPNSGQTMLSAAVMDGFSVTNSLFDGELNAEPISAYGVTNMVIANNEIKNAWGAAIRLQHWKEILPEKYMENVVIENNVVYNSTGAAVWIRREGDVFQKPKNLHFRNNAFFNNYAQAILCDVVDGLTIEGNSIYNNSLDGVAAYPAFDFTGTVVGTIPNITNVYLTGNRIYDSTHTVHQTSLYRLNYVDTFVSKNNIFSQINTTSTIANSINYYIQEQGIVSTTDTAKQDMFGVTGLSNSGSFTRSMSASSGDTQVTGVGFAPKSIQFLALAGSTVTSWGFNTPGINSAVSTYGYQISGSTIPLYTTWTANSIGMHEGVTGGYQAAIVSSYQPDGFTLTWTKGGSPSAETFRVFWMAQR